MFKIMIVDDAPDIVDTVKTILEGEGYTVLTAESGKECLKKLETEKVDLILMDFFMPEIDGRMVVEKIREDPNLKPVKIVFLTAADFQKRGMEILKELNVIEYIKKPFDVDDFKLIIKKKI